ncbi:MAG: hypothetical protein RL038_645, partial [Actinomycetota bacterium]
DSKFVHFKQTANIDLSKNGEVWNNYQSGWAPIGDRNKPFYGSYDGGGYTINNLYILRDEREQGLFGVVRNSVLQNIKLVSDPQLISVSSTSAANYKYYFGALAGSVSYSDIRNIESNLNVASAGSYVGGIIGGIDSSNVQNIKGSGTISVIGNDATYLSGIGGLFGEFSYGSGRNLEFNGEMKTAVFADNTQFINAETVGGIVGNTYNAILLDVKNSGTIQGSYRIGGIAGMGESLLVKDAENTGDIIFGYSDQLIPNNAYYVGGLIGQMYFSANLIDAKSTGNIHMNEPFDPNYDNNYIGGAVGAIEESALLDNVHVKATIDSGYSRYVGGIVGGSISNGGTIQNSSFEGVIENSYLEDTYVGGAVGYTEGQFEILKSWAIADITAPNANYAGGLIGFSNSGNGAVAIQDSFARGQLLAGNHAAGLIGYTGTRGDHKIHNTYTTVVPTITATEERVIDAFANGVWLDYQSSSIYLESELGTSTTLVNSATLEAMRNLSMFVDYGWEFAGEGWRWAIDSAENDGLPRIIKFTAVTDSGGSSLEKSHSSEKMFLIAGSQKNNARTYAINVSSKYRNQVAKVNLYREGKMIRTLIKTRLNQLGNKFATKRFELQSGDVLVLKVGKKRFDRVTIK